MWRYQRHEQAVKTYIYILLAVATIPLTIQAVASQAIGLYGWWLSGTDCVYYYCMSVLKMVL